MRSSVLGGAVVADLDEAGGKRMGYVYAGSALLASEQGALVKWQHRNPVTGSLRQTRADTSETGREELDPEGVNLGTSDPALNEDAGGGSAREREGRAKAVLGGGADGACFMDFMAVDCAQVYRLLDTGVAVQCPNNDCGPRVWDRVDQNGNVVGHELGSPFRAYADGFSGFLPPGAHYVGGGVWHTSNRAVNNINDELAGYGRLGHSLPYVQLASLDGLPPQTTLTLQDSAVVLAINALTTRSSCSGLFDSKVNPADLLRDIVSGKKGQISFMDLAPDSTGITDATTQGKDPNRETGLATSVVIKINNNKEAAWTTGASGIPGVNLGLDVARALLLLHELGHAAVQLHGPNSSNIIPDGPRFPDSDARSASNQKKVYEDCFK